MTIQTKSNRPFKWMFHFKSRDRRSFLEFESADQIRLSSYGNGFSSETLDGVHTINLTGTSISTVEPLREHQTNKWELIIDLLLGTGGIKHYVDIGKQFYDRKYDN